MLRRDEGGASLVEFALVLPLILMLVLGLVSAGIAYNEKITLTHAAREAARFAATLPISNAASLEAWLAAVEARAVADAAGSLDPGTPGLSICIAYVYPDGSGANDSTKHRLNGVPGGGDCFTDGRPGSERRVQIEVGRAIDLEALFFSTTIGLESQAVSRFEAGPSS